MTPKTSPEGHDRRDVPGSCRARSPALHVGRRDRVASAAVAAVAAAVGRRRRSSPSAHAASSRPRAQSRRSCCHPPAFRRAADRRPRARRLALSATPPDVRPVLRVCGGRQGAGGSPGPAVIGGPPCCQRRLDRLAQLAGARWTRLTRRRPSPAAAALVARRARAAADAEVEGSPEASLYQASSAGGRAGPPRVGRTLGPHCMGAAS